MVTELAVRSLHHRLRECREKEHLPGIPPTELTAYMTQAAAALDFLHAQKIVHRDIKPGHLLLLGNTIRISDVSLDQHTYQQLPIHQAGNYVTGTPAYMPPEMWNATGFGPASDQYALAATYFHLRTGSHIYPGKNIFEIMAGHLKNKPNLSDLTPREQVVVQKALAKEPKKRYSCCSDFALALQKSV
jgi:serine/threonine protein kinase